jgi:hypothetical protein
MSESNIWFNQVMADIAREDGIAAAVVAIEKKGGPFSTWVRLAFPEGPCQRYLGSAIYIAFADRSHEFFGKYINWAIDTSKRALEDPRFEISSESSSKGWMNSPTFPGNLGEVRAVYAISKAISEQSFIVLEDLKKSASEISESALLNKGGYWNDEIIQGQYLYAVRLVMIAGDWDGARRLLSVKRKFDVLSRQFEVLLAASRAALEGQGESADLKLFEEYFKTIRRPDGKDQIYADGAWLDTCYRLEFALIRQRLIQDSPAFPDWGLIFESIYKES